MSKPGVADSNVTVFEAHDDVIEQNDVPPDPSLGYEAVGGITALGGWTNAALPNQVSANRRRLTVVDTRFSGNQDADIHAFGAQSSSTFPGTDNHVEIVLTGVSPHAVISIVDSEPPDPNGTNTVVVRRHGRH